jgi:elongation factor Ts
MPDVTPQMVKQLRERTDLPMMECKQALTECAGNFDEAIEWLRHRHKGKMADRADRATGEGRIGVHIEPSRRAGAIVELQCESAPVAKNELFIGLANLIARKATAAGRAEPDLAALRTDPEIDGRFTEVYGKIRETMNLAHARRLEGAYLASYVHHDGKSGVLIALDAVPTSEDVARDLCMHATFARPLAIDRGGIPTEAVERIRREAVATAEAEGKPEPIIHKIAEGRVNAFYAESSLMEQLHARSDVYGKKKVGEVLKEAGVNAVLGLAYMRVGTPSV